LRRWNAVRGSKRAELQALFAANRRLFKAYVLREQLDRLWMYKTRTGVLNFLNGWIFDILTYVTNLARFNVITPILTHAIFNTASRFLNGMFAGTEPNVRAFSFELRCADGSARQGLGLHDGSARSVLGHS
jgi:hypothetical protein